MGAAFIHHLRQAPSAGGPQSAHLQPGSTGMIYLGQLVASPIGFICLLGASPLTDLHTLRFLGTQAWNPPPHIQAPTLTTSHPTSESTAPTPGLQPRPNTQASLASPQTENFQDRCKCLCLIPPSQFPPSLLHLSEWDRHPPRLQPHNRPHSFSPHQHTPSDSAHESGWLYLQSTS